METDVFPLPGTILCCSSIRQNIKLDQERGGLNPSLLACCSQAKQLSLQFLQHLHFKQHYPCSATYPCLGKCPALKPECIKASEGQSSISSTVPTLCWFGIRLKKSELCSFEPPPPKQSWSLPAPAGVCSAISIWLWHSCQTLLEWHRI